MKMKLQVSKLCKYVFKAGKEEIHCVYAIRNGK